MSVGHGSGIIDKAWTDELVEHILADFRFDHSFNIPLAGGSSQDATTVYMDKAIPLGYVQRDGKEVPAWHYLCVHEAVEKWLLDAGLPYLPAHAAATAVEIAAVENDGYDVNQYDAFWSKQEKVAARHNLGDGTPPDLETKPYEET